MTLSVTLDVNAFRLWIGLLGDVWRASRNRQALMICR